MNKPNIILLAAGGLASAMFAGCSSQEKKHPLAQPQKEQTHIAVQPPTPSPPPEPPSDRTTPLPGDFEIYPEVTDLEARMAIVAAVDWNFDPVTGKRPDNETVVSASRRSNPVADSGKFGIKEINNATKTVTIANDLKRDETYAYKFSYIIDTDTNGRHIRHDPRETNDKRIIAGAKEVDEQVKLNLKLIIKEKDIADALK